MVTGGIVTKGARLRQGDGVHEHLHLDGDVAGAATLPPLLDVDARVVTVTIERLYLPA